LFAANAAHFLGSAKAVRPEQIRLFIFSEQVELGVNDGTRRIACRRKAFESKRVETHREVLEEVAFVGIVAVAQHALAPEMGAIVLQLVLHKLEVRVELVLLVPR